MNVVFDFGGVLFRWQPHELVARVLPEQAGDAAAARRLADSFFQSYGGDWAEFDRGTIEPAALVPRIARRTGLRHDEVQRVLDAVPAALEPMAETVALLRRLAQAGRPLYFLSNMPAPYAAHLESAHDFVGLFRAGVFSARVGLIKPEPAIFELAQARFGIDPATTLFIDDHPANIDAARAAGWQAVHFTSPAQCAAELRAMGLD
jgi:putative hydrolase of the HAD superfamily